MSYSIEKFYKEIIKMNQLVGNNPEEKRELHLLVLMDKYNLLTQEESGEILESIVKKDSGSVEKHDLLLDGLVDTLVVGYFLLKLKENQSIKKTKINKEYANKVDFFVDYINFIIRAHVKDNFVDSIEDIIKFTEKSMEYLDFDFNGAFEEVMVSNFTKFPLTKDIENPDDEVSYIENQGRYTGVHYKVVNDIDGNERFIFYNDIGKFIKPSCFKEPNLKKFLNNEDIIEKSYSKLDTELIEILVEKLKNKQKPKETNKNEK